MALKDWFRGAKSRGGRKPQGHSVNDLIAMERLDEALELLEARLKKNPNNHHTRLNMADLLMMLGRPGDAVDQYLVVADGYARDGFFDKGHALLAKLSRLMPNEAKLVAKARRLEWAKELDRRRGLVQEAIRSGGRIRTTSFAVQHLWDDIVKCPLIELMNDDQLTRLFRSVELRRVEQGKVLVEEGEQRDEMFIVVQGEVAAQVFLATGSRTDLRAFSSGDIFGEEALLQRRAWPATYLGKRRTSMLGLGREGLEELLIGDADPRGLLNSLRVQGHDRAVFDACSKLGSGGGE